jgi:hypothetical protein
MSVQPDHFTVPDHTQACADIEPRCQILLEGASDRFEPDRHCAMNLRPVRLVWRVRLVWHGVFLRMSWGNRTY